MAMLPEFPPWLKALSEEDLTFLRRFILASGSLKDLATEYEVSYPTIRGRLDRLIAKIAAVEEAKVADEFERQVKVMVASGTLTAAIAKQLLIAHRQTKEKGTTS